MPGQEKPSVDRGGTSDRPIWDRSASGNVAGRVSGHPSQQGALLRSWPSVVIVVCLRHGSARAVWLCCSVNHESVPGFSLQLKLCTLPPQFQTHTQTRRFSVYASSFSHLSRWYLHIISRKFQNIHHLW